MRTLALHADHFYSVHAMSDAAVVQHMRAARVDVLVDLMAYTRGARLRIAALRPAPVVVSYLGFPGSSGVRCALCEEGC